MNSTPLFSVVIPTYHRNDLLAKCLDCLAPGVQILPAEQYEVIVTDDGFKSTAEEMIRDRYPWVKWVTGPGEGPAANRNNGVKQARGQWLAFTDDDCLPYPSWLAAFSSALLPDIYVYEGKTTCEAGVHSPLEHSPINLTGGYLWSCNMIIDRNLFRELGGFDQKFPYPHMEDADLRERIKQAGYTFLFVEEAVVDHPPKRLPWGNRLGAYQESYFYYFRKRGKKYITVNLLQAIVMSRLRAIRKYPISKDSLLCLLSLFAQLFHVINRVGYWDKKYRY